METKNTGKLQSLLSMRLGRTALAMLAAFLMDTSIIPQFYNGIFMPSFTFAMLLAIAIRRGVLIGLAFGALTGFFMDVTTSDPVGLYTATYLIAVGVSIVTYLFSRNLGKIIVQTVIYILFEIVFMIIAYASTIRMEVWYIVPAAIRVLLGSLLCTLLQLPVKHFMTPDDLRMTRSRRGEVIGK